MKVCNVVWSGESQTQTVENVGATDELREEIFLGHRKHRFLCRGERMRFTPDGSVHRSYISSISDGRISDKDEELTSFAPESQLDNVLSFLLLERDDLEGEFVPSSPSAADVKVLGAAVALDNGSDLALFANRAILFR